MLCWSSWSEKKESLFSNVIVDQQIKLYPKISFQVDFTKALFEKKIPINDVFAKNEMIDMIGVTKGKGFKG